MKSDQLPKRVMGLDLSLKNTGICILHADDHGRCKAPMFWEVGFELSRSAPVRSRWLRLAQIVDKVLELVDRYQIEKIVAEDYAYAAKGAQNDLGELHGSLGLALFRRDLVLRKVNIGSARSALELPTRSKVIKGRKVTVKERIRAEFRTRGLEFGQSDDHIDAYVVAKWLWMRVSS